MTAHPLESWVAVVTCLAIAAAVRVWSPPARHELDVSRVRPSPGHVVGPARLLGAALRRLARLPDDPAASRFVGRVAVTAVLAAWLVSPLVGALAVWGGVGWRIWSRRARRRRAQWDTVDCLPDLVDLLRVAVSAGCTPSAALDAVAARITGPAASAVAAVCTAAHRGQALGEAVALLVDHLGEPARPLAAGVTRALRDGTPLLPTLDRLSADTRAARRRQVEARARRLPIALLFPLVLCTLPAFALLTVVPLLLTSLQSLPV